MRMALTVGAMCFGFQAVLSSASVAQPMSRAEDRTVRLGDTIVFTVPAPHKLRFGGSVGSVTLTPLPQINNLFTLTPPLPPSGVYNPGQTVTAKVKTTAPLGDFRFACGQHPDAMLSHPVTVAAADGPARTFKIKAAAPLKWILEKAEVQLDTTP